MILSRKHNKPFHPPLSMNQSLINNVNSHKLLGLTFLQDCSWHDHLELVKAKAWLRINIMRRLNFQLDRKSLQTIHKLASIQSLLSDTGWESLTSRREKHKLVLFYRMIDSLAPEYLSLLVPPTVGNISQFNFRNETNLQTIPARSQQYFNPFLPSTTRIWNSLPDDTKNSPSVESFKHKLNNNITKPPYYFLVHD